MYADKIERIISICEENNIEVKKGLSEKQIELTQEYYKIIFPPDLKKFLSAVKLFQYFKLTPSPGFQPEERDESYYNAFYDWFDFSENNVNWLKHYLNWPIRGALFDVENNNFWLKSWGEKPSKLEDRLIEAKNQMEAVPKLIPVSGHRYISSEPNEAGNPIYSVHQMDIIFYGENLWDYFEVEFDKKKHSDIDCSKIKKIPFWHDVITKQVN